MVEFERIHPASRGEWRSWLQAHHAASPGVWVVQWRTVTGRPRVPYADLVEEALCFGWIDSRTNQLDDERSMIMMTPRRLASTWAPSNKQRVERLIAQGRMTDAGLRSVEAARANGAWAFLDDVEAMVVPDDLLAALATNRRAQRSFESLPPSAKKSILYCRRYGCGASRGHGLR